MIFQERRKCGASWTQKSINVRRSGFFMNKKYREALLTFIEKRFGVNKESVAKDLGYVASAVSPSKPIKFDTLLKIYERYFDFDNEDSKCRVYSENQYTFLYELRTHLENNEFNLKSSLNSFWRGTYKGIVMEFLRKACYISSEEGFPHDDADETNVNTIDDWVNFIDGRIERITYDLAIKEDITQIFNKILLAISLLRGIDVDDIKTLLPEEFNVLETIAKERKKKNVLDLCRDIMGIKHNSKAQFEQSCKDAEIVSIEKREIGNHVSAMPELYQPNIDFTNDGVIDFCVEKLEAFETEEERKRFVWFAIKKNPVAASDIVSRILEEKITQEDELYSILTCFSIPEGQQAVEVEYGISAFEPLEALELSSTVTEFSNAVVRDLSNCQKLSTFRVAPTNIIFEIVSANALCSKSKKVENKRVSKNCLFRVAPATSDEYEILNYVNEIGDFCFSGCKKITKIIVPESVTHIGLCAFSNCTALVEIEFKGEVCHIDDNAFENCSKLKSINLPEGLKRLQCGTFNGCTSLEKLYIPESVAQIGRPNVKTKEGHIVEFNRFVFWGCAALTEISISDKIEFISTRSFHRCDKLKKITVRGDLTDIIKNTFSQFDVEYVKD